MGVVTVALPTLNAGPALAEVLAAVRAQRVAHDVELLICDSASDDDTVSIAESFGARVITIDRTAFSHGGTRNLLMREARGEHVAFLTQDAIPARDDWLHRLLDGFTLAEGVGLVFGPYLPRPDASRAVAGEITRWFSSVSPDGAPRVDRLSKAQTGQPSRELLGPRSFFTDANGCVARGAWDRVPFREVAYAEDQQLALDMLRAGYAKVYVPDAAVVHSHEYAPLQHLRRCFDEWRGLREVYDYIEPLTLDAIRRNVVGPVRADLRAGGDGGALPSIRHHALRYVGAVLGSRADRMSPRVRARLSLEGRASFIPASFPR